MASFIKNIFSLVSNPLYTSKSVNQNTTMTIEFNNENVLSLSKMLKQLLIKYKILNVKYPKFNFNFTLSDLYLKDIWFYEIYIKKHLQISKECKLKGNFEINLHTKLITINYTTQ
jgi:hypothetical protein